MFSITTSSVDTATITKRRTAPPTIVGMRNSGAGERVSASEPSVVTVLDAAEVNVVGPPVEE